MAPWVRRVFIHILPRLLVMKRPVFELDQHRNDGNSANCKMHYVDWTGNGPHGNLLYDPFEDEAALLFGNHHHICPEMKKALQGVFLIAEQKKRIEESTKVSLFCIGGIGTYINTTVQ